MRKIPNKKEVETIPSQKKLNKKEGPRRMLESHLDRRLKQSWKTDGGNRMEEVMGKGMGGVEDQVWEETEQFRGPGE